jgi:hypothetical protein
MTLMVRGPGPSEVRQAARGRSHVSLVSRPRNNKGCGLHVAIPLHGYHRFWNRPQRDVYPIVGWLRAETYQPYGRLVRVPCPPTIFIVPRPSTRRPTPRCGKRESYSRLKSDSPSSLATLLATPNRVYSPSLHHLAICVPPFRAPQHQAPNRDFSSVPGPPCPDASRRPIPSVEQEPFRTAITIAPRHA